MTATTIEPSAKLRARPREGDAPVLSEAALAFAQAAVHENASLLEGATVEELRDDLLDVLPIWDHDGMEMAQALNRRHGYPLETALVELMAGWAGFLADAHRNHVRAWVRETAPEAPIGDVARVAFADRATSAPPEGVAYRTARGDETAICYVVPDGERERFIRDGAFAGGRLVSWEDLTVTGPGTDADMLAFQAMGASEVRQARARAYQSFAFDRKGEFEASVSRAGAAMASLPPAEARAELSKALAEVQAALSAPGFDPAATYAATLVGVLGVLRTQAIREAFEARSPGA